jgi:predicted MFS family arabinose efflux permease
MATQQERLKVLGAGILSLVLVLGVARFAYTPLLPLMQAQAGLGVTEAGWLAAINYGGYLCGALLASFISDLDTKDRLYRAGLLMAILSTVGMAWSTDVNIWLFWRFLAGLSSAAGMLLGSGLILNWLIRNDFRSELGIHFAGIGLGIVFCSVVIHLLQSHLNWAGQWWALGALSVLLAIPAWRWLPKPEKVNLSQSGRSMADCPPGRLFLALFMAAYFCAGFGYVVSATFIVAIVDAAPGMQGQGTLAFLFMGLAAAPACILWDLVARRTGELNALILACVLQIGGILLPVWQDGLLWALLGSFLFGGTFIGIVSLVLTMAGRYYPTRPAKMMGKMTIAYGVAQILGPAITGLLARESGSYTQGLWVAAALMLLGTVFLGVLRFFEKVLEQDRQRNPVRS